MYVELEPVAVYLLITATDETNWMDIYCPHWRKGRTDAERG